MFGLVICPKKTILIPNKHNYVNVCSYHQTIHLDKNKQFRVNSSCEDLSQTISESWFVLPPLLEFYYKRTHPTYKVLPTFRNDCAHVNTPTMEFIYPKDGSKIILASPYKT